MTIRLIWFAFSILILLKSSGLAQQERDNTAEETQKNKLKPLAAMDGHWRGTAWFMSPSGERRELTQTERIGPLLGGVVKVVEGRGYDSEGKTRFNAFAVIAYDLQKKQLTMRSYAQGRMGDFEIQLTEDGYKWEIPAGKATMRYTAKIKDGKLHEFGERIIPDEDPVRFFEMTLKRLGNTNWPAAGAVKPK